MLVRQHLLHRGLWVSAETQQPSRQSTRGLHNKHIASAHRICCMAVPFFCEP